MKREEYQHEHDASISSQREIAAPEDARQETIRHMPKRSNDNSPQKYSHSTSTQAENNELKLREENMELKAQREREKNTYIKKIQELERSKKTLLEEKNMLEEELNNIKVFKHKVIA